MKHILKCTFPEQILQQIYYKQSDVTQVDGIKIRWQEIRSSTLHKHSVKM